MSKHTPGPWRAVIRANQKGIRSVAVDMPPSGAWVLPGNVFTDEDVANARLIAAAPLLLAEAKELLRNASFADGQMIGLTQDAEALEKAIAKAEGRE